jgi:hypothetical protein
MPVINSRMRVVLFRVARIFFFSFILLLSLGFGIYNIGLTEDNFNADFLQIGIGSYTKEFIKRAVIPFLISVRDQVM